MDTIPAAQARLRFRDVLDALVRGEHVGITRYDRVQGVVVPVDWYEKASAALARQEKERPQ